MAVQLCPQCEKYIVLKYLNPGDKFRCPHCGLPGVVTKVGSSTNEIVPVEPEAILPPPRLVDGPPATPHGKTEAILKKLIKPLTLVATALLVLLIVAVGWRFINRASLVIDAQIVYSFGGPQPVARQTFYLLDADLFSLSGYADRLAEMKGMEGRTVVQGDVDGIVGMLAWSHIMSPATEKDYDYERHKETLLGAVAMSQPIWGPHLVQSTQTDFKGHGVFENLKSGTYWLMGMTPTRAGVSFWNVQVSVGRGENKLMLDQGNALYGE